ncbi:MBOAT family O-acyltransferase [Lonepinella sp. BR2271]|uniref:MBOAT family O-acyltransferase n=1 Tax=Lonepinella sp. BR2271 TaxID=3434550 RepID=UPI003F6E0479
MPLLSIEFAVFFLIFLPFYWLFRATPRVQNLLLLMASLAWLYVIDVTILSILLAFSLAIFIVSQCLLNAVQPHWRKLFLALGVGTVVTNLAFFKYYDFFRPSLQLIFGEGVLDILMPLGLSYYSFQAIAYLVSIYRQEYQGLEFTDLLLHFNFFPTITSGPIFRVHYARGDELGAGEQLTTLQPRQIIRPALAIGLILLGIAKKWWLAGVLAADIVTPVFENPMQYDSIAILSAVYGYTFQLFFDFSGYTDLVIGMAMLLGFQLPRNFNMPLIAHNVRDFWNRWHISLSTWIRDYIYIPLGGSKSGFFRTQINLIIAMFLSGIWHGYGYNFALWGLLHGLALVGLNIGDKVMNKREVFSQWSMITKVLSIIITFHFTSATFVVFNTTSLADASLIFNSLFTHWTGAMPSVEFCGALVSFMVLLVAYPLWVKLFDLVIIGVEKLPVLLWIVPISLVFVLIFLFAPAGIPSFIYANF